jgi:hypothetical protein
MPRNARPVRIAGRQARRPDQFVAFAVQKSHIAGAQVALNRRLNIEPAGSAVYADSNLIGISTDSCRTG